MEMTNFTKIFSTFRHDESGATVIEFSLVAATVFLLVFGVLEFSLIFFTKSLLESATDKVARLGRTGTIYAGFNQSSTTDRVAFLYEEILDRTYGLIREENLTISTQTYASYDQVNLLTATPSEAIDPNTGAPRAGAFGAGSDVILYQVTYEYPVITPILSSIIGDQDGNLALTASLVAVNEAF